MIDDAPRGTPEVSEIHYDVWSLRITLNFEHFSGVVYVDFETPNGFRVLDEGDLLEVWEGSTKEEWLYVVEEDGWLAQEAKRPGFVSDPAEHIEYLVAGCNDCVTVMALDEPTVTVIDAN